jgi:hypothetical protein
VTPAQKPMAGGMTNVIGGDLPPYLCCPQYGQYDSELNNQASGTIYYPIRKFHKNNKVSGIGPFISFFSYPVLVSTRTHLTSGFLFL